MSQSDLIFDIGLHHGLDANFYLKKGFRVVGLEANPAMCAKAASLNREFIEAGHLKIIERALYDTSGSPVFFYVNPDKDDWGSLFQRAAEQGVGSSVRIEASTITLSDLVIEHGVPYYAKCDIEGGDTIFARQLAELPEKPNFVSLEATRAGDLEMLASCGYDRFQIVNQYLNPHTRAPNPAREGCYVDFQHSHHTSGLFGRELPEGNWRDYQTIARLFTQWYDIQQNYNSISVGWLDVHACNAREIGIA